MRYMHAIRPLKHYRGVYPGDRPNSGLAVTPLRQVSADSDATEPELGSELLS